MTRWQTAGDPTEGEHVEPRLKNKVALTGAALAAAAFAGGAYAATQSGSNSRQQFINDVAHRLNVTPDQLRAALKGALIDRINQAVKDGRITQAQANTIEQRINQGQLPLGFGGHGFGGQRVGHPLRNAELGAAASYLDLTDTQLIDQLRSGKSLAQVAKDKGKTSAGLEQALTASFKTRLDKAVAAGRITQAQEQTILQRFQSRLDRRINRDGLTFGRMHAGRGIPGGPGGPGHQGGPGGPGGPGAPGGPGPWGARNAPRAWGAPNGQGGPGGPRAPGATHPAFEGPPPPPPAA
jgi:hypothetical protein